MSNIDSLIKELENKINEWGTKLQDIEKSLKNKNVWLEQKEKELKQINKKLWSCQQEKDNIQKELGEKITEVENSNLKAEDKSKQIIELVGDGFERLSSCSQSLNKLWTNYASSRDVVIELLKERDKHSYEAIWAINDTKKNQWIIIWVLLAIVILLSLSAITTNKKRKKRSKLNNDWNS